ncbi:MAG: hypothetical protein AMXMBFR12_00310 [Candidatus Babeliales bacterium]
MLFTRISLATSVTCLLLLPACGPHYHRNQLPQITKTSVSHETKNNVTISAHHMNRADIQQTFGTRGRKLGYYGLCPIQLSIKNNSTDTFIFDPMHTTLPAVNHADVVYCLQNHTTRNTAGLVGLGLLATGAICIYTLPFALWYYATGIITAGLYIGLGTATGTLLLTPPVAVYYAKQAHRANRRIYHNIKEVAVTHTRAIAPGQELDVILFTKKENCKKDFSLSLINEATQEVTRFNFIH